MSQQPKINTDVEDLWLHIRILKIRLSHEFFFFHNIPILFANARGKEIVNYHSLVGSRTKLVGAARIMN